MFKESLKLVNFKKVFPLTLVSVLLMLVTTYGMNRRISSEMDIAVSIAMFFTGLAGFIFFYSFQNQVIANELAADIQETESPSIRETLKDWKSYLLPSTGIILVFFLMYQAVLPLIGSFAGGLFQVTILGISFNLLTFLLNMMAIIWLVFGIVAINTMGVSFLETFNCVINFAFTNFQKVIIYLLLLIILMYAVLVMLIHTMTGNQMIFMPIKVLVMAYVLGFLNTYAINLFIYNVEENDFITKTEPEIEDKE